MYLDHYESIADRVASDHTVVSEDVQWFHGVCRRVERETRIAIVGHLQTRMDEVVASHGVGEMSELLGRLIAEIK